jgi:hypothetical protein
MIICDARNVLLNFDRDIGASRAQRRSRDKDEFRFPLHNLVVRPNSLLILQKGGADAPGARLDVNNSEEVPMSLKTPVLAGVLVVVSLATGIAVASAAETGTKTMPDSSIYPPAASAPVFDLGQHYECYLLSEPCDNEHRVEN